MTKLLPCKCGGMAWKRERIVWEYTADLQEIEHWIECTECKYHTHYCLNKPETVIKEWNKFQQPETEAERIKREGRY